MVPRSLLVTFIALGNALTALSSHVHGHGHVHRHPQLHGHSGVVARSSVHLNTTCSPEKDCPDFACCSESGKCGVGQGFCGEGCISNCNQNPPPTNTTVLLRRAAVDDDPYSCSAEKPCGNGACCGESGYCGYGPIYCGTGCTSNCGATAECGKFAAVRGTKCPLNTCCSEFGFCGTTKEFCDKECQSNCIEHPKPPGSKGGDVLNRVIGYWEAWNARSKCHNTQAVDLPLEALTHVNYAFAYIDPTSFEITTMDAQTPVSTFQDAVDLKALKPDLKVFVSIGGWTFSDNGTATQPVFGNIARSATNREKFANNLLKFLNSYGFDGVDLDWEYPGAPDRGGKKDDTANYVELVKTLRSTFDKSGRDLGVTYTAPSSFWYLRWFDLPAMDKHVDWVNLMSYDLHGIWDSDNPVGAIVQGHSNLTEIQKASELFWRVGINPSKIALGFGFYGRAFTLQDPSCTKPGCPFSGGAKKGACTGTSGYLAHYEVQDILKKNNKKRDITVHHDEEAAVKYMTWDNDQWISYDDADTFKQKKEWANNVGFSGSLIWASDLDDYDNTAHKAFTGNKELGSRDSLKSDNIKHDFVETANAFLGQGCIFTEKVFQDVTAHDCGKGMQLVGYDAHGCSRDKNHKDVPCGWPMCCPASARMKDKCTWRGSEPECNGKCHDKEVKIGGSSWGGTPFEDGGDTDQCNRGGKAMCCTVELEAVTSGCYWTEGCDDKACGEDEEKLAHAYNIRNECLNTDKPKSEVKRRSEYLFGIQVGSGGQNYCCKKDRKAFDKCHWIGSGDCVKNQCARDEVTLATSPYGDVSDTCRWWREKSLCCTANQDTMNKPVCDADLCELDSELCEDPDADEPDYVPDPYDPCVDNAEQCEFDEHKRRGLEKRAKGINLPGAKLGTKYLAQLAVGVPNIKIPFPSYPSLYGDLLLEKGKSLATLPWQGGIKMADNICLGAAITYVAAADMKRKLDHYTGSVKGALWNTEHHAEHNTARLKFEGAASGTLVSGAKALAGPVDAKALYDALMTKFPSGTKIPNLGQGIVQGIKGYGSVDKYGVDWNAPKNGLELYMTTYGSWGYRYPFIYFPGDMNTIKSKLLSGLKPLAETTITEQMKLVLDQNTGAAAANYLMSGLHKTFGVVSYHGTFGNDWHGPLKAKRDMIMVAQFMADTFKGIDNFPAYLKEWDEDYYSYASQHSQAFMKFATSLIWEQLNDARVDPETSAKHIRDLITAVQWYRDHTVTMRFQNFL